MINITREQFYDFIKSKHDKDNVVSKPTQHYLDYFDHYQRTGKKESWNWSALWGAFWFAHRQINWFWFPLFAIDCVICTQLFSFFSVTLFIVLRFLFARYADYFYLMNVSRKISQGQQTEKAQKNEVMWGDPYYFPEFLLIDLLIFLYKAARKKRKEDIVTVCGVILIMLALLTIKFYSLH